MPEPLQVVAAILARENLGLVVASFVVACVYGRLMTPWPAVS